VPVVAGDHHRRDACVFIRWTVLGGVGLELVPDADEADEVAVADDAGYREPTAL